MFRNNKLTITLFDIQIFLLAVLCICFLSPLVQRTIGTNGLLIIVSIYLLLGINPLINSGTYARKTIVLMLLYVGIVLLYSFIGKSASGGGQTNNILFLLSYLFLFPVYPSIKRRHICFILFACIMTIFITMAQNYALFIRMGNRFTQQWYRRANILETINTQYVSAIMFFSGVLFSAFLTKKGTRVRFVFLGMAILCFAFNIVVTQRTIAFLLSIIMLTLLMLVRGRITRGKLIRYGLFIFLMIIAIIEYQPLLSFLADVFNSDRIRQRVNSINTLIMTQSITETEAGSLTARIRLIGTSISTFFSSVPNFLFGVGDKTTYDLVGNHSHFFDEFAKFGIIGGILNCWMLFRMIKTSYNYTNIEKGNPLYKFMTVIFFTVFIRSLLGGIMVPSIGIVMFIILPLAFLLMKTDSHNSNNMQGEI